MKSYRATILCILLLMTLISGCISSSGETTTAPPQTTSPSQSDAPIDDGTTTGPGETPTTTTPPVTTHPPTTAAPTTTAPTHPPTTAPPTATPMEYAWPFVRNDVASSAQTNMDLPSSLSEQWSVEAYPQTTPVVEYGRVYIGVRLLGEERLFGLCCFDLETGDLLWSSQNGDPYPSTSTFYASPAVADGKVVFVRYDDDIVNVTCYNAITGDVHWNTSWDSYKQLFSPIISGDRVFLTQGRSMMGDQTMPKGAVMCLDFETGMVLWAQNTTNYVAGPAALGSGGVLIATTDYMTGDATVERYDAETGRRDWSVRLDNDTYDVCTPTYDGGSVYVAVGTSNGDWDYIGRVYCIDATNGSVSWTLDLPNAVHDGWQPILSGTHYIVPVVMNGVTTLYAVNTTTRRLAWSHEFDDVYDKFSSNGEYLVCVRNESFYNSQLPNNEAYLSLFDLELRRMVWNVKYSVPKPARYWESPFIPALAGDGIVFAVGAKIAWYK